MRVFAPVLVVALTAFAASAFAQTHDGHGGGSAGEAIPVAIGFADYRPAELDVVRGETVQWTNESVRRHTVTSDTGLFESGDIAVDGRFAHRFDAEGAYPYHCRLHAGIVGRVDVHTVLLDRPASPAGPNRSYPLHGRSALPDRTELTIEEDAGGGFRPVATARTGPDGTFTAAVVPRTSGQYRAVSGPYASPPVQLLVLDRKVSARAARHGRFGVVRATVTPAAPGQTVVLQLRLKERFGWWPVRTARLDRSSRVRFRVPLRRSPAARVVLTLRDGATPLAVSPAVRIPRSG